MDLGLKGKKVILTGGSRGLGRAALEHFAKEGADVAFFSRNEEQVKAAENELKVHGGKVFAEAFEVSDMDAYSAWLTKAADELGGCDIFVHNMSSSGAGGSGDWDMTYNLDIKGAVTSIETLTPFLEKSGEGSVIFMSSTAAVETFIRPQAFNALKAALITYGKQLSQSLGPKGIRVNMVSPGPISYPGGNWSKVKEAKPEFYDSQAEIMALGRFGSPDEIAKTVVFLASSASSYTTGTNIIIDGGYTKRVQF
ncbi:SDR family NAD(P)-dependent oxidoreductase [Litorimonas haliclonae]|uniref:SDR family NAD(P)-dependent oxidoreductase n=1 Tax=Litorimonas haliclonae TaxID=2081977 RepID=UPI0039EEB32A